MMLTVSKEEKAELKQQRFIFQRKYSLYYIITFLAGCRRHIFTTFAVYALVQIHHVKTEHVALLMTVNSVLNICTRYILGHFVDRIGEKRSLALGYSILIFVFIGYAQIKYLPLLYVLYCLDNMCFGFEIATTTYLDKIAPQEHIMQTISLGITMNHLSAIPVPIIGGLIWQKFGYSWTFMTGAVILLLSLIAISRIRTQEEGKEEMEE
jgi:predicted MFS family arabinose efflux permease